MIVLEIKAMKRYEFEFSVYDFLRRIMRIKGVNQLRSPQVRCLMRSIFWLRISENF